MSYDHCKTAYNKLTDAWNMFMDAGRFQNGIHRPDSYTSWIRCEHQRLYGPQVDLSEQDLLQKQAYNRALIYNSRPIMQQVNRVLSRKIGSNYAIILTDAEGLVMDVLYRNNDDIPVGNRYHEMMTCSNAINISCHENKIIEVYGYDHIYPQASEWNTVGDSIFNDDKSVAGALGIISGINQVSPLVPIVKIGTQLIQSGLLFEQTAIKKIGILMEEIPSAVIAVNNQGVILNLNREFLNLFNVPEEVLIGQNIRDYLIGNIDYDKLLSSSEDISTFDYVTIRGRRKGSYTIVKKSIIDNLYHHSLITLSFTKNRAKNIGTKLPVLNDDYLYHFDDLIGATPSINLVKRIAQRAAGTLSNVLIEGESGTGKELLAQSIHTASRPDGPFIAINCGAFTKELLQSELFGYEEGAFTGALKGGKPGQFELADGGSLFLDEIGEMPLEMQVSLLRCLQDKTVTRVGGTQTRKVDVRIIAATNRNLYEQVKKGNFREDLYYRLNVIEINMPALRDRLDDLPLLCKHILDELGHKFHTPSPIEISPSAMDCLCNYDWPGNVRELKNIMERALVYSDGGIITWECLPLLIRESSPQAAENNGSLKEFERLAIIEAISKYNGNISKSAAELGIARSTLYQKMERLGISPNYLRR